MHIHSVELQKEFQYVHQIVYSPSDVGPNKIIY